MPQGTIEPTLEIALEHHRSGRAAEAAAAYRQMLARQPNHADALHLLGVLEGQSGRRESAIELIRRAIAFEPHFPAYHNNLGNLLREARRYDEAVAAYREAIRLRPDHAEACNNLGNVLSDAGDLGAAISAYRRAVELKPAYAEAWVTLGLALQASGRPLEAAEAYRAAVRLKPDLADAHNNLGNVLHDLGQLEASADALSKAVELKPDFAEAHANLGVSLGDLGQNREAITAYRTAIRLNPELPEAHHNLGMILLQSGDFAEGWREYEWRWKCKSNRFPVNFTQPKWEGEDLRGRTILLHAEQGAGDAIQFVRYAPMVAERGGRVIVQCPRPLVRLFRQMPNAAQIIAAGDPLPQFDLHCPLMSLPLAFATTLESIPANVPYVTPEPDVVQNWAQKLNGDGGPLRIGLAWAGNPSHQKDKERSISLPSLAPLAAAKGITFYSLQKGTTAAQAARPPAGMALIDLTSELTDFADTAALIANLDLIITVDTAIAHLAGAMGKRTWVLLPFAADWRWMLARDDSPWYPTLRLFRQCAAGDWREVIDRVAAELVALTPSPNHFP